MKRSDRFGEVYARKDLQADIAALIQRLLELVGTESRFLEDRMGYLSGAEVEIMSQRLELLKDTHWALAQEVAGNIEKVRQLIARPSDEPVAPATVQLFKKINSVLNSLDRLEVRGRDSAGLSLMFAVDGAVYDRFARELAARGLRDQLEERTRREPLVNQSISINPPGDGRGQGPIGLAVTYKVAAEIGSLGDNVDFLRREIQNDPILQILAALPHRCHTVSAHTRWASVGAISEANCHPLDNHTPLAAEAKYGLIHACLNGDIDNYLDLRAALESDGRQIHKDINTDTKVIPLQVEKYIRQGLDPVEAFRRSVNDFEGSHAICLQTDLAPGKLFLAQRGSGQAIFVGIAEDFYMPASEVYGFVEETPSYIKLDGERIVEGRNGKTQGQIVFLDQASAGGLAGIQVMYYDGTPLALDETDLKHTDITTRDTDRQDNPHYFLKEILESPLSVEKTLHNRWKINREQAYQYTIALSETVVPPALQTALAANRVRRIFFVGQGTAGVAAQACADILSYYMNDPALQISALKASELSGFKLEEHEGPTSMADTLVVAITQSGTTTDTNRTVDMVKDRGAFTLAIVNRRDSDITFKVDGVLYTSSGRDIEMSVASTKAFYAQIVAGALLSLYMAQVRTRRNAAFVSAEIKQLLELPGHMRKILAMRADIEASARRLAAGKPYWAAVGSGPNKASADEIRIKLSELCYKTISSDFVEDKKHIDLSSEPLIIVCAAGTRGTVIGDIIKDTAIFRAHKATTVVIADEGERRFDPYAADVFRVPAVGEHLAPIVNTLVGHLWGYYAALTINEGSRFLYAFREDLQQVLNAGAQKGMDVYEAILEKSFREKIVQFYTEFRQNRIHNKFPTAMGLGATSDLTLLLKYLAGRLPVSDFELDFGKKGTALNILNTLFECLGESINNMARPVDAIKHQAKTVTVGTSRISEKVEGVLFDALAAHHIGISQITNSNILVLKNLQQIVAAIEGTSLYRIAGLNLLGEPVEETSIELIRKTGGLQTVPSRVEKDKRLKGTKRIIVRQGNVYIGKGRVDERSIIIIPAISTASAGAPRTEHLLLLNISFRKDVPLPAKIKALGGKYEHLKNLAQESIALWEDGYLDRIPIHELFGRSAEKLAEHIVSQAQPMP